MRYIKTDDRHKGVLTITSELSGVLSSGKPVLWLVCGGSNIKAAVEAMDAIRSQVSAEQLSRLTVGLTDERYGSVGHPDSNWKQLEDAGFDFSGIFILPVLKGKGMDDTVSDYSSELDKTADMVLAKSGSLIALFGMGADGHIAGILPHSPAVDSRASVAGYDAGKFKRVTITPAFFDKISSAYAFVFGEDKIEAVVKLRDDDPPIDEQPAQLFKKLPDAAVFSDQL